MPSDKIVEQDDVTYADVDTYLDKLRIWHNGLTNLPVHDHLILFTGQVEYFFLLFLRVASS